MRKKKKKKRRLFIFFRFQSSFFLMYWWSRGKSTLKALARVIYFILIRLRVFFIGVFLFARLSKHCKSMIKVFFELFGIVEGQAQSLSERDDFGWAHPDLTHDRCPAAAPLTDGAKG